MKFEIGKTEEEDAAAVAEMYREGSAFLRASGVDQWQNGYPNEEAVQGDLTEGTGYVMETERGVDGYACISFTGEPCYADLQGEWLSLQPYVVIHRMAISNDCKGKGAAGAFFGFAQSLCAERQIHSMKVDTDADNKMMQQVLKKFGFTYCGTVCFDNSEKIAFEKLI